MGAEIQTSVSVGSKSFQAKVLLETNEIIIRGEAGIKVPLAKMKSLSASDGSLSFSFDGAFVKITLGEKAGKWLEKIKNPKSVLEKLGVKPESTISVVNIADKKFISEIKKKSAVVSVGKAVKDSDLIFYEANSAKEATKLESFKKFLKPNGGIWVLSLKGKSATIKDTELMAIGKKCGLVDNKVVGFSETHTALKFVIPISKR